MSNRLKSSSSCKTNTQVIKTTQSWISNLLLSYSFFFSHYQSNYTCILCLFSILPYVSLNSQLTSVEPLFVYMQLSSKQLGNGQLIPQSSDVLKALEGYWKDTQSGLRLFSWGCTGSLCCKQTVSNLSVKYLDWTEVMHISRRKDCILKKAQWFASHSPQMNAEIEFSKDVYVNILLNPDKPQTRFTLLLPVVNILENCRELLGQDQAQCHLLSLHWKSCEHC